MIQTCLIAVITAGLQAKPLFSVQWKMTQSCLCVKTGVTAVITAIYLIFCVAGGPTESCSMRYLPWVGTL